jgi:hypothetical protein
MKSIWLALRQIGSAHRNHLAKRPGASAEIAANCTVFTLR